MRGLELAPLCVPPCEQEAAEEGGKEEEVVVVDEVVAVEERWNKGLGRGREAQR